jgi:hypothetical protein
VSGRDAVDPTFISWERVWALFEKDEQHAVLGVFWDACCEGEVDRADVDRIVNRLSKKIKHRPQSLRGRDRTWIVKQLHPRALRTLSDADWAAAFRAYYSRHKRDLMCRFLDLVGIEHDDNGLIPGDWDPPDEARVRAAVPELLKSHSVREVARYLAVLARQDDDWRGVVPEMGRLLAISVGDGSSDARSQSAEPFSGPDPSGGSSEFSVLDRVLIREIVRSLAGIEGAVSADELEELVEDVIILNEARQRNYFHLGLMHVLSPGCIPDFDRPELNDARREWYLAGIVAGLVRTRDSEGLRDVLAARGADFARAAATPGGPGASLAKLGFEFVVECGLLSEATALLRGQLSRVGLVLAAPALRLATGYVRQNEFGSARAIIDVLRQHASLITGDAPAVHAFHQELGRRWGQCLQAAGDFAGAETAFKRLDDTAGGDGSPDLLADRGLVKGRFRSLGEVRLPDTQEQRTNLRDQLANGEPHFRKAVETHGVEAPKACYALAMLAYVRYSLEKRGGPRRESLRIDALTRVREAVTALHQSASARAYEDMGVLAQARFLQAVVQMESLDPVDARAAMDAWRGIAEFASRFPKAELRGLVEAAEAVDATMATEIAEAIWTHRPLDAPEILAGSSLRSSSDRLVQQMLAQVRQEHLPRQRRMELWCWLVPAMIRSNDRKTAEEGVDALEDLAEEPSLVAPLLDWFSNPANYDPALDPAEAAWVRVRLLRRLGRDAECSEALRQLFFKVRDSRPFDAAQILEAFRDWALDPCVLADLEGRLPVAAGSADLDARARLERGETVRVLFVGGNEVQARYDDAVRTGIAREWPGIAVVFEHTGWSSNWGRDVPRLLKAAAESDAVVLMPLMRTMLGRTLRDKIDRPWIACTSTGKGGMLSSVRCAAMVAVRQRLKARETAR